MSVCVVECLAYFVQKSIPLSWSRHWKWMWGKGTKNTIKFNRLAVCACICKCVCTTGRWNEKYWGELKNGRHGKHAINLGNWKTSYALKISLYITYWLRFYVHQRRRKNVCNVFVFLTWALCCLQERWQASSLHCCTPDCYCRHTHTNTHTLID